jgi:hypothetical protein
LSCRYSVALKGLEPTTSQEDQLENKSTCRQDALDGGRYDAEPRPHREVAEKKFKSTPSASVRIDIRRAKRRPKRWETIMGTIISHHITKTTTA